MNNPDQVQALAPQEMYTIHTEEGWSYDLPVVKKPSWKLVNHLPQWQGFDAAYLSVLDRKLIIIHAGDHTDGKRWIHASMSHPMRVPTYAELKELKEDFIGRDRKCIMVFPEQQYHVNLHENVLHLWSCLDEWGIPEFSGELYGVDAVTGRRTKFRSI